MCQIEREMRPLLDHAKKDDEAVREMRLGVALAEQHGGMIGCEDDGARLGIGDFDDEALAAPDRHELRAGMFANFVIRVAPPRRSPGIPSDGIVREGDGTMTAWVTTDRRHFSQRIIKTGLRTDDQVQVLEGLQRGELVVGDGAVFLSNMLQAPPSD